MRGRIQPSTIKRRSSGLTPSISAIAAEDGIARDTSPNIENGKSLSKIRALPVCTRDLNDDVCFRAEAAVESSITVTNVARPMGMMSSVAYLLAITMRIS